MARTPLAGDAAIVFPGFGKEQQRGAGLRRVGYRLGICNQVQHTAGVLVAGMFERNRAAGFISAIVPQGLPSYLSNCLFCFEGNVRYASILGYVGAGGLGLILNEKIGWREYASVGMILLALFVTVFIIETISRAARKRLV